MPDSDCRKRMYGRMRSLRLYQPGEGSLVRAELESYLDVLEPMLVAIRAVQQDALLQSCSEQRLMAFERMLAIPINENIPLEERRQIAVSKMSIGPSDFHREGLEKALNDMEPGILQEPRRLLTIGDHAFNDLFPLARLGARTLWVNPYPAIHKPPCDGEVATTGELADYLDRL